MVKQYFQTRFNVRERHDHCGQMEESKYHPTSFADRNLHHEIGSDNFVMKRAKREVHIP